MQKRATLTMPLFEDEPDGPQLTVTYRPKSWNRSQEKKMNIFREEYLKQMPQSGNRLDEILSSLDALVTIKMFLVMVESWDLRDDASGGAVVPLTEEGLDTVPTAFLGYITRMIQADQTPDPTTETPSSLSSGTTTPTQ